MRSGHNSGRDADLVGETEEIKMADDKNETNNQDSADGDGKILSNEELAQTSGGNNFLNNTKHRLRELLNNNGQKKIVEE